MAQSLKGFPMIRTIMLTAALTTLAACGGKETPPANPESNVADTPASSEASELFAIEDAWVRLPLDGKSMTAAYFTLNTMTDAPATIISVTTPNAETAELHTHILEGTTLAMRKVDALEVPIGGSAELRPMSDHIMLFGVQEGLKEGDTVTLELTILSGGEPVVMTVNAPVKPLG